MYVCMYSGRGSWEAVGERKKSKGKVEFLMYFELMIVKRLHIKACLLQLKSCQRDIFSIYLYVYKHVYMYICLAYVYQKRRKTKQPWAKHSSQEFRKVN